LMKGAKKGKQKKIQKYAQKSQEACGSLEGIFNGLDTSINANAYQQGKKGPEVKKDYKKAMIWYTTGGGRGSLLGCLGKVKASLQL
jgi:hypothetical protein